MPYTTTSIFLHISPTRKLRIDIRREPPCRDVEGVIETVWLAAWVVRLPFCCVRLEVGEPQDFIKKPEHVALTLTKTLVAAIATMTLVACGSANTSTPTVVVTPTVVSTPIPTSQPTCLEMNSSWFTGISNIIAQAQASEVVDDVFVVTLTDAEREVRDERVSKTSGKLKGLQNDLSKLEAPNCGLKVGIATEYYLKSLVKLYRSLESSKSSSSSSFTDDLDEVFAYQLLLSQEYDLLQAAPASVGIWEGLDIRDLVKNPLKYVGRRVVYEGTVSDVKEDQNLSYMQVVVGDDSSSEVITVEWEGASDGIYKGGYVRLWGNVHGTVEGKNVFGGNLTQPLIRADFVGFVKEKSK